MARVPNILCAGGCGALLYGGRGSLASGLRTCRSCRIAGLAPIPARTRQPGPFRSCTLSGCERKHFALGSCRQHYYQQRAADGKDGCRPALPRVEIGALATAKDCASSRPCLVMCDLLDNGGMFVYCPDCSGWACVRGDDPMVRVCDRCETTIRVNTEEASWVLYETLSMAS